MVALQGVQVSGPVGSGPVVAGRPDRPGAAGHRGRAVAVTVDAMELLRPESDLARLLDRFPEADVLLAARDVPDELDAADIDADGDSDEDIDTDVASDAAALGLPDLHLHRLGLHLPLGPGAESDVVAAMSELVGFDPEPGVYCLAPAPSPTDPARATVGRAAQRIAQVYGLPLLRYRCLELTVVGPVDAA